MRLRQEFATDEKLETEGVWHELGDGARVKVARLGNPAWQKEYNRLPQPIRNAAQNGRLKGPLAETFDKRNAAVLAKTILVGWDGMEDEHGQPLPYSVEAAEEALRDLKDFRALIVGFANGEAYFRAEATAEAGNGTPAS